MPFTKAQEKAIAAYQRAEKSPAFSRASAFTIIPPVGLHGLEMDERITDGLNITGGNKRLPYGIVRVAHPADGAGKLQVFVWDTFGSDIQHGTASGGGYNKLDAAMSKIVFDGIKLVDGGEGWRTQLERLGYVVIQAL